MTFLLLPHLSSSLTDSPPFLNLLYDSKTDARFMQDAPKPEVFHTFLWHFFPNLKHNFTAYCSKMSDCIFEIPQLWQSGFSRVYSNSCCSCSIEREIIKVRPSSYEMYRNSILIFQVSPSILNAHPKKVWKLIECTS